ncbi:hypothetical protein Tco_0790368 [Tanacetum coccineum]
MDNSKRGTILMQERLDLNKSQGAQTPKEVNRMKNVPYASAIGSIMYAVYGGNPSTELRVECYCDAMDWEKLHKQSTDYNVMLQNRMPSCIRSCQEAVWI